MRLFKSIYLKDGKDFLVRMSRKPKSIKIINSKIIAYANAKSPLPMATEMVVKP